jgi:hypothetical protein
LPQSPAAPSNSLREGPSPEQESIAESREHTPGNRAAVAQLQDHGQHKPTSVHQEESSSSSSPQVRRRSKRRRTPATTGLPDTAVASFTRAPARTRKKRRISASAAFAAGSASALSAAVPAANPVSSSGSEVSNGSPQEDAIFPFDDDPSRPGASPVVPTIRTPPCPDILLDTIPDESAIYRVFQPDELRDMLRYRFHTGTPLILDMKTGLDIERLGAVGYVVLPDVIKDGVSEGGDGGDGVGPVANEPSLSADNLGAESSSARADLSVVCSRASIDRLFRHFRSAFSQTEMKCCGGGGGGGVPADIDRDENPGKPVCWISICNQADGDEPSERNSLRFQTPLEAIHQHLEMAHPVLFRAKLSLDVLAALILKGLLIEDSRRTSYRIPRTGARLLLSAPGCTAQPPHTDFPVSYSAQGRHVADPSYFMILTGKESATVRVWPGSHRVVAIFEYAKQNASATDRQELDVLEAEWCGRLMPTTVSIPAYSCFVARGDLVHAGDSNSTETPAIRAHIHCMSTARDTVVDNIFIRPFGEPKPTEA